MTRPDVVLVLSQCCVVYLVYIIEIWIHRDVEQSAHYGISIHLSVLFLYSQILSFKKQFQTVKRIYWKLHFVFVVMGRIFGLFHIRFSVGYQKEQSLLNVIYQYHFTYFIFYITLIMLYTRTFKLFYQQVLSIKNEIQLITVTVTRCQISAVPFFSF